MRDSSLSIDTGSFAAGNDMSKPLRKNYVLIDYENVHVKTLSLLTSEQFWVYVFLGPKNTKLHRELVLAMHEFGNRATYVELHSPGSNALDFHLAYYLGALVRDDPEGFFHIISKDTGFDPLISHLKSKKILAARSVAIEDMPCFRPQGELSANLRDATPIELIEPHKIDALIKLAIEILRGQKKAKPGTEKTLRSTLRAKLPKAIADPAVDLVVRQLQESGWAKLEGKKMTYPLLKD